MSTESHAVPEDQRQILQRIGTDLCFCSERLDRERAREQEPQEKRPEEIRESEQEILSPLLNEGFEIVGSGLARCVLRFPTDSGLSDYVVKLARFGAGSLSFGVNQNQREVLLWKRHGVAGDWPLLPVVDYHLDRFRWIVMPYGDPITERPKEECRELLRQVRGRLKMLPTFDIREVAKENVVLVDESPLLADYGLPDGC